MLFFGKEKALKLKIKELEEERDKFKSRCVEIEDAIEKNYGVKTRNEVTVVNSDFSKAEMVVMFASMWKLINDGKKSHEDLVFYMALHEKIALLISKMKE